MADDKAWFQDEAPGPSGTPEDFWEGDSRRSRWHLIRVVALLVVVAAIVAVLWRAAQALS